MASRRRDDSPLFPLLVRGVLLLAGTAAVARIAPQEALLPALALLIVLAFGAIPIPSPTGRIVQAFAEVTVLGLVIGSIGDLGYVYIPLLLLPVFSTGQRGGLVVGAAGGGVGGLAWALGVLSTISEVPIDQRLDQPAIWTVLMVVVGLLGGWVRRLTHDGPARGDVAYEQAFDLLTQLRGLARDLSLGLDPVTLADALLDDVAAIAPHGRRTIAIVTAEGRLAPLVAAGDGPNAAGGPDDATTVAAWREGLVQHHRESDGSWCHAWPVRMGEEVVAVLTVHGADLTERQRPLLRDAVEVSGPRLASAVLFDEVRRAATVDERLRLAREIHDGIAQELASVGYLLDDVASRLPADAAQDLHDLRTHVRKVTSELRLSIFDLRSGVDETVSVGTALSEHVQRVGQQSDLVVHTVLDEYGDRLPVGVEVELLRIAQEAVTNVRKHAQASNLWVECTVDAPRAWVRIADDGIGLQPAGPQSMGMRGMRERARRIGGDLQVSARAGGGTVVEVTVGDWDDETRSPA